MLRGIEWRRPCLTPLLRHLLADVVPEVAELGALAAGNVVGHRHARELDDAAFDGVHEREVAHRPGEERPLGVARAAQEERRRRQVDDADQPELLLGGFEARDPEAGGLAVLLGLLAVVPGQILFVRLLLRLLAVAVVRLVVDARMFFMPIRSGMTRWSIWPSDSSD